MTYWFTFCIVSFRSITCIEYNYVCLVGKKTWLPRAAQVIALVTAIGVVGLVAWTTVGVVSANVSGATGAAGHGGRIV